MIYTHQRSLATLDDDIVHTEIAVKLEMRVVLEVEEVQTFTPFETSNVKVFFIKLGWGNIHVNVFSGTVSLNDTSIETLIRP